MSFVPGASRVTCSTDERNLRYAFWEWVWVTRFWNVSDISGIDVFWDVVVVIRRVKQMIKSAMVGGWGENEVFQVFIRACLGEILHGEIRVLIFED